MFFYVCSAHFGRIATHIPHDDVFHHDNPNGKESQRRHQGRHGREEVRLQAVVGHGEDGRLRVLVDRHDHLGVLHPGQVLDRPGDAHGDVQLG
ncbi:MAG: hypothetical protein JWR68_1864, partial [Polaromonas sp.]|nr:hypothetical protein [Polaromonas sp.]